MTTPVKNERKARGGKARSLALSPERRKEIAQKAALSRWGTSAARKPVAIKMLKGIPALKKLTVTCESVNNPKCTTVLTEDGRLLRSFVGSPQSVNERVQSYLAALQDLGIVLDVTYSSSPEPTLPAATTECAPSSM